MAQRANPVGFLREIAAYLRSCTKKHPHLRLTRHYFDHEGKEVTRDRDRISRKPNALVFGKLLAEGSESGSLDPAYQLEVWTDPRLGEVRCHFIKMAVKISETVWYRFMRVVDSSGKSGGAIAGNNWFDLRLQRDHARTEILGIADDIVDFWQNEGAIALLTLLEYRQAPVPAERSQYVVASVSDQRGSEAKILWCADRSEQTADEILADVLMTLEPSNAKFTAICIGDGYIEVNENKKTVVLTGESMYGMDSKTREWWAFNLLHVWYPGYTAHFDGRTLTLQSR